MLILAFRLLIIVKTLTFKVKKNEKHAEFRRIN